jgi:hypothetical protein
MLGALCALAAGLPSGKAQSHYPAGLEGLGAGILPEPGWYVRHYTVVYRSTRLNDVDGQEVPVDFRNFSVVNALRPTWASNWRFLDGEYGCSAYVPLVFSDVLATGFHDDALGLGDVLVEPVTLTWRRDRYAVMAGYAFWAPTGHDDSGAVVPGLGLWTQMFSLGGTWHPDAEGRWEFSALCRYEFNSEARRQDVSPGDTFTLEWGAGYAPSSAWAMGFAGYFQRQLFSDDGTGLHVAEMDSVIGLGPEVRHTWERIGLTASMRYAYEVVASDRPQGHTLVFTLTKKL